MWARDRSKAIDVAALFALKLAVGAWVLHLGFSHVSDDDYARTVIAERFAHHPRLDPSGTSWLPLPFWIDGSVMILAGRSLAVARTVAIVLSTAAVAAPYLAMRTTGASRASAWVATAVTMGLPWNAWLGVATVPEGYVGAIAAGSLMAMGYDRARPWAAAGLLGASLSRYETWPMAWVFVAYVVVVHRARTRGDRWSVLLAASGAPAWMAWNASAHGSAFHFVARVTAFRQSMGAAALPLSDKFLGYPLALLREAPETAVLGVVGICGLAASKVLRQRWTWPAIGCIATLAFLIAGDLGDGAPTHHPARALCPLFWVLDATGIDALGVAIGNRAFARNARLVAACGVFLVAASWCASLPSRWAAAPGKNDDENRDTQIRRGLDLRDRLVPGADVTPCAFEHFALIAAWGEPERAHILERSPRVSPGRTWADCPRVVERP